MFRVATLEAVALRGVPLLFNGGQLMGRGKRD